MGHYRWFFPLLICACLFNPALVYAADVELVGEGAAAAAPEADPFLESPTEVVPLPDGSQVDQPESVPSGGEITIEDGKDVYHIEADTIIIQPVTPADTSLADGENDLDPGLEDVPSQDGEEVPDAPLGAETVPEDVPMEYPNISGHALDSSNFPFYGSCWVTGTTPDLGTITLFFPTNYKTGYIGLDNSGRLFNVSNNSWSGVLYVNSSGVSYTVNFGAFGLPSYRRYSGSSYTNVTLYLTPTDGNIVFPDGPSPVYSLTDLLPYFSILLLGGVFLCSMRKS